MNHSWYNRSIPFDWASTCVSLPPNASCWPHTHIRTHLMDSPGPGTPLCLSDPSPMGKRRGFFTGTLVLPSTAAICKQSVRFTHLPSSLDSLWLIAPKGVLWPKLRTPNVPVPNAIMIQLHGTSAHYGLLYSTWCELNTLSLCRMLGLC